MARHDDQPKEPTLEDEIRALHGLPPRPPTKQLTLEDVHRARMSHDADEDARARAARAVQGVGAAWDEIAGKMKGE